MHLPRRQTTTFEEQQNDPALSKFRDDDDEKKTVDEFWGTLRVFVPPSRRAVCRDVCPSRSRVGFSDTQRLRCLVRGVVGDKRSRVPARAVLHGNDRKCRARPTLASLYHG